MKDARIYLRIEGEDPFKAVNRLGDSTLVKVDDKGTLLPQSYIIRDGSLIDWITRFENEWEETRKKGFISLSYPIGATSQIIAANKMEYKLINDIDLEILPDDSYSGILLFPVIASYDEVVLKMYDLTTETDAAGNPTEKVTFEFKYKINEGKMWYDHNQKTWVDGEPPSLPTP